MIATIIGALLVGIVVGALARLILPGKQDISLIMTMLIGAAAALVGGFIATWLGVGDTSGIDWIKLIIQVAIGAVAIAIYTGMAGNKTTT